MANSRLLNFISENEVEEIRKKREQRGETEPTVPDKPLFEILKENRDKQQAEFNERFKHQPPKALDEDETDFLEKVAMHKREQELQLANEESQQLRNFQLAVASRTLPSKEPLPAVHRAQEVPVSQKEKRPAPVRSILSTIKVKSQPKKAKVDEASLPSRDQQQPILTTAATKPSCTREDFEATKPQQKNTTGFITSLVAYGTDSEEEE